MPTMKVDANVKEVGDIPLRSRFIPIKDLPAIAGSTLYKKIGQDDKVVAVSEFKPKSAKHHFPRDEKVLLVE